MHTAEPHWYQLPTQDTVPAYSVFDGNIQKSEQDDREYRIIRLENGLHATVVSDPKADKAAASLDVAVGHLYDPDDMPGLAHFCEHLLFMGTEKFPRENEYSEFLAKNSGSSNAYTSTSTTNYFFHVSTPALPGALERFAAFFHCPLFAPSCTLRELNAVDSEHKKNHQNDIWRIFQLNKHLSKPGHVWSKFGTGNKASLERAAREMKERGALGANGAIEQTGLLKEVLSAQNGMNSMDSSRAASPTSSQVSTSSNDQEADGGAIGRETRKRLVEWWSKQYCASRMRVCVIGQENLDELSNRVATLFSPIPNRGVDALPMINDHPFGPEEKGTLVSVQTIMDFHVIEMSWPLPWQPPHWRYKPANFLSHFLGHEGPGSLHSYLKRKGWITALSAGPQNLGRGFAMFKCTIHLTKDGFKNYRSIMLATHKYLALLRSSALPAWIQREMALITQMRFRFKEKRRPDDYAVWVAEHMAWPVPHDLILSAPALTWEWDDESGEKEVRKMLAGLDVGGGRAVLMARADEFKSARDAEHQSIKWEQEPVYGTPYAVERFDAAFVKEASGENDIPELFLPGQNEFIPEDLSVEKLEGIQPARRPFLIRETAMSSLWHKKDDRFWVPKAHTIFEIRSPIADASPKASVMTRLYADLVNDSLTEFAYDADLAGLTYNFAGHTLGMYVTLNGYSDKLPVLSKHVFETVRGLKVDPERLHVMKEQLKRDWKNFFLGQTYRISDYFGKYAMTDRQWTLVEKLPEIDGVTLEDLQNHIMQLLERVHIRALVVGNLTKPKAIDMLDTAERILDSSAVPANEVVDRALILPEGSNHIWRMPVPNPNEPNSSLTYYLHVGPTTDRHLRVTFALLQQILSEPAFNVLRTQEQLGYIVFCSLWPLAGSGERGLRIAVQSERGPVYLEQRVDAFLRAMEQKIRTMSEDEGGEFEEQKRGLETKWRERAKNLSEETNRYWKRIDTGYLDFYRQDEDADYLANVTKADVLELFMRRIHPDSSTRAKLSVHAQSQKKRPAIISADAINAFERSVREQIGADAVPDHWRDDLCVGIGGQAVTVDDFRKYWVGKVTGDKAERVLGTLPELVARHPAEAESTEVAEGAKVIEDVKTFRQGLMVSADPRPLVDWGDLRGEGAKL